MQLQYTIFGVKESVLRMSDTTYLIVTVTDYYAAILFILRQAEGKRRVLQCDHFLHRLPSSQSVSHKI